MLVLKEAGCYVREEGAKHGRVHAPGLGPTGKVGDGGVTAARGGRGRGGAPLVPVRLGNGGFREVRMQQLG